MEGREIEAEQVDAGAERRVEPVEAGRDVPLFANDEEIEGFRVPLGEDGGGGEHGLAEEGDVGREAEGRLHGRRSE